MATTVGSGDDDHLPPTSTLLAPFSLVGLALSSFHLVLIEILARGS